MIMATLIRTATTIPTRRPTTRTGRARWRPTARARTPATGRRPEVPIFDRIVMVDWSAAATPTTGRDSIWIGETKRKPINMPTRFAAMTWLREVAQDAVDQGRRLLIGFDFAFGYPVGVAARFGGGWEAVWSWLAARANDADSNANDRFAVAADFNARFPGVDGPLWGLPRRRTIEGVAATKPATLPDGIPARRAVERIVTNASPVWKLAYSGAVGSQTLLGIARLERWRRDPAFAGALAVWPFETEFADALDAPVTLAEIYPSLFPVTPGEGEVKDAAQVCTLAEGFAALDAAGALRPHLAGPSDPDARAVALAEEGWIMGVGDRALTLP